MWLRYKVIICHSPITQCPMSLFFFFCPSGPRSLLSDSRPLIKAIASASLPADSSTQWRVKHGYHSASFSLPKPLQLCVFVIQKINKNKCVVITAFTCSGWPCAGRTWVFCCSLVHVVLHGSHIGLFSVPQSSHDPFSAERLHTSSFFYPQRPSLPLISSPPSSTNILSSGTLFLIFPSPPTIYKVTLSWPMISWCILVLLKHLSQT